MIKKFISFVCILLVLMNLSASGLFEEALNYSGGDTLVSDNKNGNDNYLNADANISKLEWVYKFLLENYVDELDADALYKGAMEGMFSTLDDPYSEYFEKTSQLGIELQDTLTGSFGGIGVTITKPLKSTDEKPAYVEVMSAVDGTPGAKAGLRSGDYITEIDGKQTAEITMMEVLKILRGKVGTKVTIKVLRGKNVNFDLTLTRAKIEVPTVKYKMLDNGIGYIKLLEFNPNSARRIEEAYNDLAKQACNKLIFDLRDNGGGLLSAAMSVSSFFLESGDVVSTNGRMPNSVVSYKVDRLAQHLPTDIPVVTLINSGSASASEIVAGALKDNKRSVLVGTKTYGKGVVQMIYDLNDREAFKFTSSRYYTPSGANINEIGIPADYQVDFPEVLETEAEEFSRLYSENKLEKFAKSKKDFSTQEIKAYAKKLQADYKIRLEILEMALRARINSYSNEFKVDTEFDPQLKKAIEILQYQDANALAKEAKTVAELQSDLEKNNEEK